MNADYTPTTSEMRAAWIRYRLDPRAHPGRSIGSGFEFDGWLAAHDRNVVAEALRGAMGRHPYERALQDMRGLS